jgi:hypothetical protein
VSTVLRQQALLVAEAWQNIYSNQSYVDFQSYSQDNLVNAILNYVQVNYPDNFNDWITNSEFVIKVRTLAWLHQNISYRLDLDVRENFIQTATRRDALLMLAENVFYVPNRVTGASGELRIESVSTSQTLIDSNGDNIANVEILWNDAANPDWFEQFILVMNAALTPRTQFGHPLVRYNNAPTRTDLYMLNARAPSTGCYPFSISASGGTSLPFAYINVNMDKDTGVLSELPPNPSNAQRLVYRSDGLGSSSPNTGFFLPIRQGTLGSLDQTFSTPQAMQQVTLGSANLDNDTIFVEQLDSNGNVSVVWTEVDSLYGRGVAFNTLDSDTQAIYEVHTLLNDRVRVQFGDGKFGAIPTDKFRFWYRTVSPVALSVQTTDIQKQTFVIPYVNNATLYFLTIRASLTAPITNAIPTDTNDQIRNAIGGAFAAQNRMVTAADYNLFPLTDPSILKLKTVNRTYSGHSAYSKITDPTGLYSGVKLLGEDGRLFRLEKKTSQFISALTNQITLDEVVYQYLTPLIQDSDKSNLYYTEYDEVLAVHDPYWSQTSEANGISKGNIARSAAVIPVGPTATDEFFYLIAGTLIRYNDLSGPLIAVQHVTGDGTGTDGIVLAGDLADGTAIFSLMPPMRNQFTNDEASAIKSNMFNLQEFGLSWNQTTQTWDIIANSNLDKTSEFSLTYQGDTTNLGKDASWMVYLRYYPNPSGDGPEWEIVNRGLGTYFESSRDVDFVYVNTGPQVDPNTGKMVRDNVNILGANEGRDSLHRLGLYEVGVCCPLIYDFTGDGVTTCFQIRNRIDQEHVIVFLNDYLQIYGLDYTINETPIGDEVCFYVAPSLGATISIRVSGSYQYATEYMVDTVATGTSVFYATSATNVDCDNSFLYLNGVSQHTGDYTISIHSGNAGFYIVPALTAGVIVLGYVLSGPTSEIFDTTIYLGDGATTDFASNCPSQTIHTMVVFVDGVWQSPTLDYTLDTTDSTDTVVSFVTAPPNNSQVVIHAASDPHLIRSQFFQFTGDGSTTGFGISNFFGTDVSTMVGRNGVVQRPDLDYTISTSGITFLSAPINNERIDVFVIYGAVGFNFQDHDNSCFTSYLLDDKIWDAVDVELTPDGYIDVDGIQVEPVDSNQDGVPDNPFEFDDILIPDGLTDLVLWRSIVQDGFSVWNPIDATTVPKGTYGFQTRTEISAGVEFDQTVTTAGDIYLDQTTDTWLVADATSGNWIAATNQNDYMSATGRSGLKFIWTHYPADNTRIDPAISNIMDVYVLTVAYDTAYRNWIASGFVDDAPDAPTSESLQDEYAYLNNYRMTDDSLIFHPINYHPLFGSVAEAAHQGTFLAIRSAGSTLSTNDLILRIINAIDVFFKASNWDLGESFYLTELIAFVHRTVAPDLQSIVLVANDGSPFGDMFQIRCAQDELFISVAQPADIQIVSSFTNDNLQIGTL